MTTIAISFFPASAIVACVATWASVRARSLAAARRHQRAFFELAADLARSPDYPASQLERLESWARLLGSPVSLSLLSKALKDVGGNPARPDRFGPELSEPLRAKYARMFAAWCLVVTYRAPIRGFIVRAHLAAAVDPDVRLSTERRVLEGTRLAHT